MRSKVCRYCRKEFTDIDFPAQFDRMVTCGKTGCMKLRRWERLGIDISSLTKKDILNGI